MNQMPRAIEFSIGAALGSLAAKAIETVVIIVSQSLNGAAQSVALMLGVGVAAMFGAAAATIASGKKGWAPACAPALVLLIALARDPEITFSLWQWGTVIVSIAVGALLGYLRFNR